MRYDYAPDRIIVVDIIKNNGGMYSHELFKRSGMTKYTFYKLIHELISSGIITKTVNDNRTVFYQIKEDQK